VLHRAKHKGLKRRLRTFVHCQHTLNTAHRAFSSRLQFRIVIKIH